MGKEFKNIEGLLLTTHASLNNATDHAIWECCLLSINNSVRNTTYEVEKQIQCEINPDFAKLMESVDRVNV